MASKKAAIQRAYEMAYRCIVQLHPSAFREQFGEEMMGIFDEAAETHGAFRLLGDGLVSLTRQWIFRPRPLMAPVTAPVAAVPHDGGLFSWEHINASPSRLPAWRWMQGSLISLALFAGVWLAATQAGKRTPIEILGIESNSAMQTRGLTPSGSEDGGAASALRGAHENGVYAGEAPRNLREGQRRQQQLAVQVAAGARVIPGAPFLVVESQGLVPEVPRRRRASNFPDGCAASTAGSGRRLRTCGNFSRILRDQMLMGTWRSGA